MVEIRTAGGMMSSGCSHFKRQMLLVSHAHHAGDGTAEKGDQPAGVDAQADAMKNAVDCFGLVSERGDQCQREMEGHST